MNNKINQKTQTTKENLQEKALVQANITEQILAEIETRYANLTISGPDDKEGLRRVRDARLHCKSLRVNATKICKVGREEAVAEQKRWLAAEKACVSRIEAVETPLKKEEDRVKAEIEEAKRKKAEAEARMVMERTESANAIGWYPTFEECKGMSDTLFYGELNMRTAKFEAEEAARRVEAERLEAERLEAERVAAEERARIEAQHAKERQRLEEERAALMKQAEELRKMQDETKQREAAVRAEQERIATERRNTEEIAEAKKKATAEAIEEERRKAEEIERRRIEAARVEAERVKEAQALAELKVAQIPDKEKLIKFIDQLHKLTVPSMDTEEGSNIEQNIYVMIHKMIAFLEEKTSCL